MAEILESFKEMNPNEVTTHKAKAAVKEFEALGEPEGMTAQLGDLPNMITDKVLDAKHFALARELGEKSLRLQREYAGYDSVRSEQAVGFLDRIRREEREHADKRG